MKIIQITLDERLLNAINNLSRARDITLSAFVRDVLEAEVRHTPGDDPQIGQSDYLCKPIVPGELDVWLEARLEVSSHAGEV
jgi:hypothetical protein